MEKVIDSQVELTGRVLDDHRPKADEDGGGVLTCFEECSEAGGGVVVVAFVRPNESGDVDVVA